MGQDTGRDRHPDALRAGALLVVVFGHWIATLPRLEDGRLFGPLDQSLTVRLWFLAMLLAVQALLPLSVRADRRWGLKAVGGLLVLAVVADLVRAGATSPATPVMTAVIAFETRRRADVPHATGTREILVGGALLLAGIIAALVLGAQPGAAIGLVGVAAASWLLRQHGASRDTPAARPSDDQRVSTLR